MLAATLSTFRIGRLHRAISAVLFAMTLLSMLAIGAQGAPQRAAAADLEGGEHLVTLTANDFQSGIAKDLTFVEFYSPYCGHCKRFAPTFKSLAEIQEHWAESGFSIKRVNCVNSGDICDSQKVTGYPSLFLYRNGQQVETYKGDRTFEDLMSYTTARASDYRKEKEGKSAPPPAA